MGQRMIMRYRLIVLMSLWAALLLCLSGCIRVTEPVQHEPPPSDGCAIIVMPGESIQAAIDGAPEGAVICLAEGEWRENLTVVTSLTLRGFGTVIRARSSTRPVVRIGTPQTTGTVTVKLINVSLIAAESWLTGRTGDGVLVEGRSRVELLGCSITQAGNGLRLEDSAQAHVINCDFSENVRGISLSDSTWISTVGCMLVDNQEGLVLTDAARATDASSVVSGNTYGVVFAGTTEGQLTNTQIGESQATGVLLRGSAELRLLNGIVSESGQGAVEVSDSATFQCLNCAVDGNAGGVVVKDEARIRFTNSTLRRNGEGLLLEGMAEAEIMGSVISENDGGGVLLASSAQVSMQANRIMGNSGYGVALRESPCFREGELFRGFVSGSSNAIPGPGQPEGNQAGSVCPADLAFLITSEGGEIDRR